MFGNGDVLIQKFGGSSMGSVERIKKVAERIAQVAAKGKRIVAVVSAMGDTTDDLIELMSRVSSRPDRRELDHVMATGEMVSASLAASALCNLGIRARSFNAFNLHLLSELEEDEYNIIQIGRKNALARFLEPGSVAVVAGFQGVTTEGDLITLGRGGSDLTAVVMARELGQKVCEKYTDEDGIYTADPRIIPHAQKVWHLNYDEMLSLALYGNGILHPRAISCAREQNIRIHVRSSFSRAEGSIVGPSGDEQLQVKSIACENKTVYARIHGITKPDNQFFHELSKLTRPSRVMQWKQFNQHQGSFRLGFVREDAFEYMPFIWEQASRLKAEDVDCFANLQTISVVGCGLVNNSSLVTDYLSCVEGTLVEQHQGNRLTVVFDRDQGKKSLDALHQKMIYTNTVST